MSNIVYTFPDGFSMDAKKVQANDHMCDEYPLCIKYESDDPSKASKDYMESHDADLFMRDNPDGFVIQNIQQYNGTDRKMYNARLYHMVGRRSESLFPLKEFDYNEPASNTKSWYQVLIEISVSEGYKRKFLVDVPTVNLTAYSAMETAIENLFEQMEAGTVPGVKFGEDDEDENWYVEMYLPGGISEEIYFEVDRFDTFFKNFITSIQIADFFMKIDGYSYDPETRECLGRTPETSTES